MKTVNCFKEAATKQEENKPTLFLEDRQDLETGYPKLEILGPPIFHGRPQYTPQPQPQTCMFVVYDKMPSKRRHNIIMQCHGKCTQLKTRWPPPCMKN